MFDLARAESFTSFDAIPEDEWLRHIRSRAGPTVKIMLVANKLDLASSSTDAVREAARSYAQEHGCLYAEMSVKDGAQVEAALDMLLLALLEGQ